MNTNLENKIVLVTGASRGIGRAIAEEFAREKSSVILSARNREQLTQASRELREKYGIKTAVIPGDLTRGEDIEKIAADAFARFGRIDVLVNNTGGPPPGFFMDISDETWIESFNLILMSLIRMIRRVIPGMKQNRWGRIINIVSFSVKRPIPNLVLSNTIRSAIPGLTATLADQFAPENILINNICPGYTETERVARLAGDMAEKSGVSPEEIRKRWKESIPMGRLAAPGEIASLAVFLASEGASYITGQTILVDGGISRSPL